MNNKLNRQPACLSAADFQAQQRNGRDASTSRAPPKPKKPSPTNALTRAIIQLLNLYGFVAWRQNNAAVFDPTRQVFRAGSATPGIADVLGYHRATGIMCAVEVKTGTDRLSTAQANFLAGIRQAGGFACVGKDIAQVEAALTDYLASPPA